MLCTKVSGNIRFMRFSGEEASNDTGWSKRRFFSAFGVYIFGSSRIKANIIMLLSNSIVFIVTYLAVFVLSKPPKNWD